MPPFELGGVLSHPGAVSVHFHGIPGLDCTHVAVVLKYAGSCDSEEERPFFYVCSCACLHLSITVVSRSQCDADH